MSQNKFTYRGKDYVAVPEQVLGKCTGCAFGMASSACFATPPCAGLQREDGRSVVWAPVVLGREEVAQLNSALPPGAVVLKAPPCKQPATPADPSSGTSDGSSADYYVLPEGAAQLQDLISYRNMNGQDAEMFRAIYRKGRCSHSSKLREAKKVLFYAQAEVDRLEKYDA